MMFNTGDIVRWSSNGALETFGRSDEQVKVKVRIQVLIQHLYVLTFFLNRASVLS